MKAIETSKLTKFYGKARGIDGLNLEVAPGEFFGFIGPNGAGKTTTIKCAVGIMQFDEGSVTIDGHSITQEPLVCKKRIGRNTFRK